MANINTIPYDNGRQQRRQSTDFGEMVSTQTEMKVSGNKWDNIFHNWEHPEECSQGKKKLCSICDRIKAGEVVTKPRASDEKEKENEQDSDSR